MSETPISVGIVTFTNGEHYEVPPDALTTAHIANGYIGGDKLAPAGPRPTDDTYLPEPFGTVGEGPDGMVLYTLNYYAHHFEVELHPDRHVEFFYLDRLTGDSYERTTDPGYAPPMPDAAAADVPPDPFLTQWNVNVKACDACTAAQKALDDEDMDDHVAWCDEHRAQFNAWGTRAAANVTVYVAGIGNVRMAPDDALRMLFDEVLEDARIDYVQAYHDLMSDAVLREQWNTYAAQVRTRLAELLGDGGG